MNIHQIGAKPVNQLTKVLQDSPAISSDKAATNLVFFENAGEVKYVKVENKAAGVSASYKTYIKSLVMKYVRTALSRYSKGEAVKAVKDAMNAAQPMLVGLESEIAGMYLAKTGISLSSDESRSLMQRFIALSKNSTFREYDALNSGHISDRFTFSINGGRYNFVGR